MRVLLLAILVLSIIIPIGMSDAFAELTVVETASRAEVEQQNWYDNSWEFRKNITLSLNTATGVDSDLTDFPVLISFTDTDLIQTNESLGRDFVFTESDGTTVLSHEIEKFDNTTGEVIAWVKLPTMSASETTEMYIYYKGDTIGFNSADVWNDDYVLVWHLNQTSTGTSSEFKDATSNENDGKGGGGGDVGYDSGRIPHITDGQIGKGQHLKGPTTTSKHDGNGDFIYRNSLDGMPSRDFTIELWTGDITNVPSGGEVSQYNNLVSVCYDAGSTHGSWQNHISLWRAENVKMKIRGDFFVSTDNKAPASYADGHPVQDDNPASFTNWNHIVAVYNQKDADGTQGNSQLYINGELVKDENRSGGLNRQTQTDKLRIVLGGDIDASGSNNCARVNNELIGKVDEFRISSGLKTADYAAASYFNQGDPDTYTTVGVEETQTEKERGSPCWDCTRPAITHHGHSETPDGFSINDAIFENNQELYNENPTIEAEVGDMVTIKARAWDNHGPENVVRVYTYLGMYEEKPNWHESEAYIEYNIKKDKFEVNDKNKIFALVGASSEVAVNPYYEDGKLNRPLELLDITFTIIFAKPMETSHIAIQTIDDAANYELVYFEDALKIKEKVIVEIPEVPEEVIPEVPEEVIPEPEPPVKEPEPEIMLTATSEKTVLSFVDENMPAKHYVKRYITEQEYREWFDVNYSEYQFWEGIGITEEKFDQIVLEIQSEPKPKMIQTGFVFVPEDEKSFPLVEETYEPEPVEVEPVKEKKGFFDWLFSLFG